MSIEEVHTELVIKLCKKGEDIITDLTPDNTHLWHMSSCICGEAGELFDAIKKHVLYNKKLDIENVIEELGDLEFYLEGIRTCLGIPRLLTLEKNVQKLTKRYDKGKYSNQSAQERADKS